MPGVFRREALPLEYMAQMAAAVGAKDFHPVSAGICFTPYSAGNLVVETGPAAARMKLIVRLVKWCFAATTQVSAPLEVVVIFPRKGVLSAFVHDDVLFFRCEFIQFHGI